MLPISYWAWLGTIYLAILTYQDYTNDMWIDERKNYFMYGITFSLLSHVHRSIWYTLSIVVFVMIFNYFGNKLDGFGEGDIQALNWVFFGFGFLNPVWLGIYVLILSLYTGIYLFFKHKVFKVSKPTPFFSILLLAFFTGCFWFQIYW